MVKKVKKKGKDPGKRLSICQLDAKGWRGPILEGRAPFHNGNMSEML